MHRTATATFTCIFILHLWGNASLMAGRATSYNGAISNPLLYWYTSWLLCQQQGLKNTQQRFVTLRSKTPATTSLLFFALCLVTDHTDWYRVWSAKGSQDARLIQFLLIPHFMARYLAGNTKFVCKQLFSSTWLMNARYPSSFKHSTFKSIKWNWVTMTMETIRSSQKWVTLHYWLLWYVSLPLCQPIYLGSHVNVLPKPLTNQREKKMSYPNHP